MKCRSCGIRYHASLYIINTKTDWRLCNDCQQFAKEAGKKLADDIDEKILEKLKYQLILKHSIEWITLTWKVKCDCGAEKCKTTHADWCSTKKTFKPL